MKKIRGVLNKLCFVLFLIPPLAHASKWVEVARGGGTVVSVDAQSVVKLKGGIRKGWVEYSMDEPKKNDENKLYQRALTLEFINCAERSTSTHQEILYDKQVSGTVVQSMSYDKKRLNYLEVVPDSFGESVLQFMCDDRWQRK